MPRRLKNVRVSVRQLVEAVDATTRISVPTWTHLRNQHLRALYPLRTSEVFRSGHGEADTDWRAIARADPEIVPTMRLFVTLDGPTEMIFKVVESKRQGRRQVLELKRTPEVSAS